METETRLVHAGLEPDESQRSMTAPLYQTSSFTFEDTEQAAALFNLEEKGHIYTRISNPTHAILEKRLMQLDEGVAALVLASGMAAITASVLTICRAGDNIIASRQLYGGCYNLFAHTLPQYGIEVRFIEPDQPEAIASLCDDKTRLVFCETIANPTGVIADLEALADAAHQYELPLFVDNTVATPYLCQPFDYGADVCVYSLTKYMGGHGNSIGGAIVDSGEFDWAEYPERFPSLVEPDPSYHGVSYSEQFSAGAFLARTRAVVLRSLGAALSPFNSFLILQGMETLALRMEKHCHNASEIARFLEDHEAVSWVRYAALPTSTEFKRCQQYTKGMASGIVSFGLKGGYQTGKQFINSLRLFKHLVNIGDTRSLACHPASTTHRQLNEEELERAGLSQDMIRLSIGIENVEDLKKDLNQAINKSQQTS